MNGLWESVKLFLASHRIATMIVTGALGASVVGAGGYALYNDIDVPQPEEEVVEEVEVEEEVAAQDVYIPEFKNVVITSESLEKDLTIYFSDEEDNPITGVPFTVKLLKPEAGEKLQSYIDTIGDLDKQIAEYADDTDDVSGVLKDRNAAVTITDENGDVVEKQRGDISSDPLYLLFLDKETAVKSYNEALSGTDGTVYTDDDEDGVISEKDVEPGDYLLCLVNDDNAEIHYEPVSYTTEANVKDKVEFKVQKEITKQIKKDVASEDGQKTVEAVPVENKLTDTIEYIDSRKDEKGSSYKETTDVVAPKTTASTAASSSKATKKDGGKTSITHTIASTAKRILKSKGGVAILNKALGVNIVRDGIIKIADNVENQDDDGTDESSSDSSAEEQEKTEYTITIKYVDTNGSSIKDDTSETKTDGESYSYSAPTIDGYTYDSSSNASGTVSGNVTVTFTYKKNETPKTVYTITIKCVEGSNTLQTTTTSGEEGTGYSISAPSISGYTVTSTNPLTGTYTKNDTVTFTYTKNEVAKNKFTITVKYVDDKGTSIKTDLTETKEEGAAYSYSAPAIDGYTVTSTATLKGTVSKNEILTFTYKKNAVTTETATLDMSYSAGTFTISVSSNVSSVKVNGTDVTIKDGKGTYKVTADGDYKLTGVATFSDKQTDSSLNVTYTVSGYSAASTEKLKDSKGNQLYLDSEGKTEATAANYEKGKTYYYKDSTYNYYGWQSINGITYYYDKNGNVVTGTQVIQGVQYNFGSDGALVVKGTGIDVSKYQGAIDWGAVARSGIKFAFIRVGSTYSGIDPTFDYNMRSAQANGIKTGVYIYSYATNAEQAAMEAVLVTQWLAAYQVQMPVVFDI